jgi:hypothetical protein
MKFIIILFLAQAQAQTREQELAAELERSKNELIHLRALSQANEVQSRTALKEATAAVQEKARILSEQEQTNAKLTQQAAIDNAVRAAFTQSEVAKAKDESKYNFYGIVAGQITTVIITIAGFWFTTYKLKIQHAWSVRENTAIRADFNENKVDMTEKLDEISALLNNEKAPRKQWRVQG